MWEKERERQLEVAKRWGSGGNMEQNEWNDERVRLLEAKCSKETIEDHRRRRPAAFCE